MTRLIDAETAKVSITRYFAVHARNLKTKHILLSQIMNNQMNEICRDVCFGLDAQQTVDAVPVVHGKWKEVEVDKRIVYCCTVCHTAAHMPNPATFGLYDYCPHCGAKMDGGADNETV